VIDEFHNYATDAFISLLSESRKFHLGLVLVTQYLDQTSPEITKAVLGNAGTLISFRVSEKDAETLSRDFGGHYDPALYSSLGNGEVVVKLLNDGRYADAFLGTTLPPLSMNYGRADNLLRLSRERYTAPRRVVEDKIRRWLGADGGSIRQ